RHANFVRGVTTAATLWFVTVLGLSFGSGQFTLGFIGAGVALATLFILPRFEKHIQTDWYATLTLVLAQDAPKELDLRKQIESMGLAVKSIKLSHDLDKKQQAIVYEVKLTKTGVFEAANTVVAELAKCPGMLNVRWR